MGSYHLHSIQPIRLLAALRFHPIMTLQHRMKPPTQAQVIFQQRSLRMERRLRSPYHKMDTLNGTPRNRHTLEIRHLQTKSHLHALITPSTLKPSILNLLRRLT